MPGLYKELLVEQDSKGMRRTVNFLRGIDSSAIGGKRTSEREGEGRPDGKAT